MGGSKSSIEGVTETEAFESSILGIGLGALAASYPALEAAHQNPVEVLSDELCRDVSRGSG